MAVTITARKNGPYRVEATEGEVRLLDAEGQEFDLTGKPAFSLCRCGHSQSKPFCDGSHNRVGFQAEDVAPRKPS
jgi:CDGSH-type Zn-finger protein